MSVFIFPNNFVWGAACSAFQLEGAMLEDGRTMNVKEHAFYHPDTCDLFEDRRPPNVGADFFHKYREDLKLFKEMGLKSFRFSISWSRIFPDITCTANQKAIDYYDDLINTMISFGIEPFFDLWHGDLPQWLLENGGIISDGFVDWFVSYAKLCFEKFGDRVKLWSTVNEPKLNVYGVYAHAHGAPYLEDVGLAMKATHNVLIAHFRIVKMLHEMWPDARIGSVHNTGYCYSMSFNQADIDAAERHHAMQLLFLDPMILGHYPDEVLDYKEISEYITKESIKELADEFSPMDFYGVNYYSANFIKSGDSTSYGTTWFETELPKDAYGFTSYPAGLFDSLTFLNDRYNGLPVFITENGYTYRREDVFNMDLASYQHDAERINYIREHIRALGRSIKAGVNVQGYFYWSVMDCWESSMGYGYPMGLIGVNFDTLERKPRDSFYYYQKIIANNRVD